MKYTLRYRIKIPWHKSISDYLDMFEFTNDWIEDVESRKAFILRHYLRYRRKDMLYFINRIKPRWESFGVEVEELEEMRAITFDKTHRYEEGVVPIIEGRTRYDLKALRDELDNERKNLKEGNNESSISY